MRLVWLLALPLIGASAQIQPPPASWVTGEPYTTIGQVTPTISIATVTTTIQMFPTGLAFVATGLPATPRAPDHTPTSLKDGAVISGVPGYLFRPLREAAVKQSTSFEIDLATGEIPALCWYPISGNYGRLPRILFYITIAAAVLLRTHLPWLYIGALAASLTYSGSAAIHACLLIWRGPAAGELDLYPLVGILSASCIITVPLINWSSTIRTAGRPDLQRQKGDERPTETKEFDAASRIILIFWSFLVTVGFIAVFIALQDGYQFNGSIWLPYVRINSGTISCAPDSGQLNVTVGQPNTVTYDGETTFNFFTATQEFLDANNCVSPCSNPGSGHSIFRSIEELIPLTVREANEVLAGGSSTRADARLTELTDQYAFGWSYIIIYILLQGVWTVCFGRNKPSETRAVLYHFFSRFSISGRSDRNKFGNFQRRGAQFIALSAYLWSVFVVLIAVPLLIIDVTLIELFVRRLPQSESADHIGAWTPYASTALVLFAAALAKSYETIKAVILQSGGNVLKIWRKIFPSKTKSSKLKHDKYVDAAHKAKNVFKGIGGFVFGLNVRERSNNEWKSFVKFWKDPEQSYEDFLESRKPKILCTCPQDYECKKHKECVHRVICTDKADCGDCRACTDAGDGAWADYECTCTGHKEHVTEASVAAAEGLLPTVDMKQTYARSSRSSGYSAVSQDSRLSPASTPQQALVPEQVPVPENTSVADASAPNQASVPQQAPVSQKAATPRRDSLPNPVTVPKRVPVPQRASVASVSAQAGTAPVVTAPVPQQASASNTSSATAPTGN
ncbi:hypothetical protein V495_00510 [Pseudogymnoascus sp. VKM F-4514 (FW-929)]|nr:hypothetical protein V495_00510 [Pseudogymnoascus sp. VKM F-4514 (FW-929)]KFY66300.1 hypothetical protein V497_00962 [Pseudogymnoascus sp. VKM F-4516 (FW-969)]